MFNSISYNPIQKVNMNCVSGTLSKTCEKSFFKSFRTNQFGFDYLMSDKPRLELDDSSYKTEVVVLQVMLMSDDRVLFEVIRKKDFEELKAGVVKNATTEQED